LSLICKPVPSNDIVARSFIIRFQKDEGIYFSHMTNLKASNCIHLDHTFKVASNIGYLRPDRKWITLYSSIFIVLNKAGQVIAWQFTKTTSIDEVQSILSNLKQQITKKFHNLCRQLCQFEVKLKAIFGDNITIKLDIFHAVQRVFCQKSTYSSFHVLMISR